MAQPNQIGLSLQLLLIILQEAHMVGFNSDSYSRIYARGRCRPSGSTYYVRH